MRCQLKCKSLLETERRECQDGGVNSGLSSLMNLLNHFLLVVIIPITDLSASFLFGISMCLHEVAVLSSCDASGFRELFLYLVFYLLPAMESVPVCNGPLKANPR